ncbi:multidrug effflux MFS transporter [Legionella bononiensis]|uniref:Multidrug effflux MFS transporter n=1 Tax=Legionella bononiensis TaxID=2793102 RepID=A0ABS1WBB4_9GAMM|nr:multidrug effflux MFS transporter [Legionella bononiensis]MBL7480935.1 multidrug effflux MFS transporter [Legionella bononiensis]MBL7526643.1 multidrug effflux MFS transporter [Legionella bononiensis]MBL7564050.1 multidrug effflux MFS transporter [Legionella bononiensis]
MLVTKTPFIYIACLSGFSLITFDLYQPALPTIINYFQTTHELGQLTLSIYIFVNGFAQLIWGPLIDHFGRLKSINVSLSLFLIATMMCIFSNSIYMLIAGRALQSFFICSSGVIALSSTRDYENTAERANIISHISMIVSISPIIAPLFGAVVFLYLGWQATFICMAVFGFILLLLAQSVLKESPTWDRSKSKFSYLKSLKQYMYILQSRHLWLGMIILTASFTNIMIIIVNITYLIINQLHYSPTAFALIFAFNGFTMILGNYIGIRLRDYFSLRWNMCFGSLMMITGASISLLLYHSIGFGLDCIVPLLLITIGVTITNPPALSLALKDFNEHAASATAVINTMRMSISSLIAGVVGIILTTNYYILPLTMMILSALCLFFSMLHRN